MPIATKYLFSPAWTSSPTRKALFNEIYDEEHVPNPINVPGVAARAYIFAAAPPSPTTTNGAQNIGWAK